MNRQAFFITLIALLPVACALGRAEEKPGSTEWIRVPKEYARFKLERFGAPVNSGEYRAVVDVPAEGKGPARIVKSSGERGVDAVALDYADAYRLQVPRLKALHARQDLRFQLLFDLHVTERGDWHTKIKFRSAYGTRMQQAGLFAVRVATGPDGRVKDAQIAVTSGSARLDAEALAYAREHWTGPPNSSKIVRLFHHAGFR